MGPPRVSYCCRSGRPEDVRSDVQVAGVDLLLRVSQAILQVQGLAQVSCHQPGSVCCRLFLSDVQTQDAGGCSAGPSAHG